LNCNRWSKSENYLKTKDERNRGTIENIERSGEHDGKMYVIMYTFCSDNNWNCSPTWLE